jgi:predicted dehydrogenase
MRRFDEAIAFAAGFVREQLGEVLTMRAWYGDSSFRYTMTDALQPVLRRSADARRPPGEPKADRRRYYLLGHGSHLVDTARFLGGDIARVDARLAQRAGAYCWFTACEFADGSIGHLDLTVSVRMDWHEGFHVYGEHGSVLGRMFQPWYRRSSEVECFSTRDGRFHRPLAPDGHFWRRQVEGLAATILEGTPQQGATVEDGLAAMRVMEAIQRSATDGGTVAVAS